MRIFWGTVFFLYAALFPLPAQTASAQQRTFADIFPALSPAVRETVFTARGYSKSYKTSFSDIAGSTRSAIEPHIINAVLNKRPGFLVESILVIPCATDEHSLLNAYNALGKIQGLKGRLYHSHTRGEDVPLFEEVTRIESEKRNVPVNDPPPAARIPSSEIVYMRLKDVNFGNSFYRGDLTLERRGLRYSLSNFKNLTYFLIPVIKEERFIAQLYFEPISEGILIYALAGADVSDFISSRIDMPSAISKRLAVIIDWIAEGILGQPVTPVNR